MSIQFKSNMESIQRDEHGRKAAGICETHGIGECQNLDGGRVLRK